jgi:hypothetical protein
MFSEVDNGQGTIRVTWEKIRERVKRVEPTFCALIDEVSPDESFPLYLLYFSYGQLKGDTICPFLPGCDGVIYPLNSTELPKEIIDDLGYGLGSCPMGMYLDKYFEYYIDIPALKLTLPRIIRGPGDIFPLSAIFKHKNNRNYAPNGIMSVMSGSRSVFMLPHIGSKNHYERLQYDFNLSCSRPQNLYDHFNIFKELVDKSTWRSCLIYFSKKWVDKITNDPAWSKVKMYLYDLLMEHYAPEHNKNLLDSVFSYIQFDKNLKPNPYLADTARHIINTAIGTVPGYVPASNEDFLPVAEIEKAFIESYGMKKYFPTILHPEHFIVEKNPLPIYYSLQYPSTHNFSPKSRSASSMLVEMRELSVLLNVFLQEISKENSACYGTIFNKIAKDVDITCIHNQNDKKNLIKESDYIEKNDPRFTNNFSYPCVEEQKFAADGKFFRGCISISAKKESDS